MIMKIGIDARFWGIKHTGIGRYIMELVKHLEKIDRKNEYIIFLRRQYFNQLKFKNPKFKKVLADFANYSFAEQIHFKKILEKEKVDLVHFPHFNLPILYQGKFVVTIHDLIKHESKGSLTTTRPSLLYWFKYLGYLLIVNAGVRRADRIIVPSFWWQKKLVAKFKLKRKKVKVTYESVSDNFKGLTKISNQKKVRELLIKYEIKQPFVIYTGNLYPHKNIAKLVEAIKKINQERELYLVIACAKNVFWQRLKKIIGEKKIDKYVVLAGFVPDEDLARLYQQAEAFVFPSLLEGFGLPGLEAMAVGLSVVCSRASCLPEIYQDAASYFQPNQINDIKTKILQVIDNRKLRMELIRNGYQRVSHFSWYKMARETLAIYESITKEAQ